MRRIVFLIILLPLITNVVKGQRLYKNLINANAVSSKEYGNDKQWYLQNIPFFECSDKKIEQVYYYRWKLYKAHLKNLGQNGYIITEFLNTMSWDLKPYNSLNDATSFHIYEGRWLKNARYVTDYINYMYKKGGNDRHFSEAIADAAYAYYLVNPDKKFIVSQLPSMIKIYNDWNDHYDQTKSLYYIEPLLDATEYTISSIDASGGKDGFSGGDAFRPSINSYMYANALAIKNIALLNNDTSTAAIFAQKAVAIKKAVQNSLWNNSFRHFTDRYKVNNQYVKYWDFIRGRELVGYLPWTYNLPDDNAGYSAAWQHILSADELHGKFGLRTNEPSCQYYMRQYRYDTNSGQRECQWNGPSWPFQTTQVLLGMANLLNNYHQQNITAGNYFNLLKQYTLQHYMPDGSLNIVEDYDPDKGGAIVNLNQRSENYNHSEYNDLIITGFCGLRPAAGNIVVVNPLISTDSIQYFCLQNVQYHGHQLSIVYDKTGEKYHEGIGLSIYIDNKSIVRNVALKPTRVKIPNAISIQQRDTAINLAVHLGKNEFPKATASYNDSLIRLNMAIDGRIWCFSNVVNYWSPFGSKNIIDWYQLDLGTIKRIQKLKLYFLADGKQFAAPENISIEYWHEGAWCKVDHVKEKPLKPLSNSPNEINFNPIATDKIKVFFKEPTDGKYIALSEMEMF